MTADLIQTQLQLFEASLAVGVLIVLVLCVRGTVARHFGPRAAYALWLLPLLRLALPPIPIPATIGNDSFPDYVVSEEVIPSNTSETLRNEVFENTLLDEVSVVTAGYEPSPVATDHQLASQINATSPEEPENISSGWSLPRIDLVAILSPLWIPLAVFWSIITLIICIRMIGRQLTFADRIRQGTYEADADINAEVISLAKELNVRQPFTVRMCPRNDGPLVCGLFRPIIVLPADFTEHFTFEERRYALGHELLHIRRGDLLALFAVTILCATQWFNPFARRAMHAFRADQEAACDASVLRVMHGQKHAYAQTLLKAIRTPAENTVPALTLDHNLKGRLRLMGVRKTLKGGAAVVSGFALLGLVSTASYAVQETGLENLDDVLSEIDQEQSSETVRLEEDGDERAMRATINDPRIEFVRAKTLRMQARLSGRKSSTPNDAMLMRAEQAEIAARRAEAAAQSERNAAERKRELAERQREIAERQRELARKEATLQREARDVARKARQASDRETKHVHYINGQKIVTHGESQHVVMTDGYRHDISSKDDEHIVVVSGDTKSIRIDGEDGMVILTDPMSGLQDRLAKLDQFNPIIPELPESPEPPQVTVVELITEDGERISVPGLDIVLPDAEEKMEEYSRKIELIIDKADIDGQVQAILGEDFEEKVSLNAKVLEKAAKGCERHQKTSDKPSVITRTENGVTHKILCFDPQATDLRSSELSSYVKRQRGLTKDEKVRFENARKGDTYSFHFDTSD